MINTGIHEEGDSGEEYTWKWSLQLTFHALEVSFNCKGEIFKSEYLVYSYAIDGKRVILWKFELKQIHLKVNLRIRISCDKIVFDGMIKFGTLDGKQLRASFEEKH